MDQQIAVSLHYPGIRQIQRYIGPSDQQRTAQPEP
jgi:hypothetical protein